MSEYMHLPSRRDFVLSAAAAALMASHECGTTLASLVPQSSADAAGQPARMASLRLQTSTSLGKLRTYYRDVLELPVLDDRPDELTVRGGESRITFVQAEADVKKPFYHFAFNIPENKIRGALDWQRERGPVMDTPPRLRDPAFPDEVRHFRNWNAHSVFFLDPAGNVLEYIARHTLNNASPGPFSSRDVRCVSEIAFIVDQVAVDASRLMDVSRLPQYGVGSDEFRAIGDENGLLLLFKRGRELGTGSGRLRRGSVFPTVAKIRSERSLQYEFEGYPYQLMTSRAP